MKGEWMVLKRLIAILLCSGSILLHAKTSEVNLIDITKVNASIRIDCVYATARNFTKTQVYLKPVCYLLQPVAGQLAQVQKKLEKEGLGLLVWDAYRPLAAQQRLWDICPDERYVSPPKQGGRHTRGTAVDLTLVKMSDGKPLEMGTGHDDFTEKAYAACTTISQEAQKNRKKLRDIMMAHGFEPYQYEWWHFDYKGWRDYPVLEIDFDLI